MARILAIDYGLKRTGIAVTDPLQLIANSLTTVATFEIFKFLKQYTDKEPVEIFIVGLPKNLDGKDTDATQPVLQFTKKLVAQFPSIPVKMVDERFTSKMALKTLIDAGTTKKFRRDKGNIDKVSATIILQEYLEYSGSSFKM